VKKGGVDLDGECRFGHAAGFSPRYNPRFVTDINADGKADVIGFGKSGAFVYLIPGDE